VTYDQRLLAAIESGEPVPFKNVPVPDSDDTDAVDAYLRGDHAAYNAALEAEAEAEYLAWEDSKHTEWLLSQGADGSDTRWRDVPEVSAMWEAQACRWCGMSMESHD